MTHYVRVRWRGFTRSYSASRNISRIIFFVRRTYSIIQIHVYSGGQKYGNKENGSIFLAYCHVLLNRDCDK